MPNFVIILIFFLFLINSPSNLSERPKPYTGAVSNILKPLFQAFSRIDNL